jgi:hypothetical protein
MALGHKIRIFDEEDGNIQVSIHKEDGTELGLIAIDLPFDADGNYLVGDALNTYITEFIPNEHYTRKETVGAGISNKADVEAMVEAYPASDDPMAESETESIEEIIDKRLKHHSLIS